MEGAQGNVTQLLTAASRGNREAIDKLIPLLYEELHQRAEAHMRGERRDHTLQPTALVNEVYLRLIDEKQADWKDRSHFLAIAAKQMRQILIRHAKRRGAQKRGGAARRRGPFEEEALGGGGGIEGVDFLEIDGALRKLHAFNARMAEIIEMRFLGGMSVKEVAEVLGVDPRTVRRDFEVARVFLRDELSGDSGDSGRGGEEEASL